MKSGLALSLLAAGAMTMSVVQSASAVVYNATTLDGSEYWYQNDTRAGGSAEIGWIGGKSALILTTDSTIAGSSEAKASVRIDLSGPKPLKNFSLGRMEWYRDPASSDTSPAQMPAIRLLVQNTSGEIAELVWEWAEAVGTPVTEGGWELVNFNSHNGYWIYSDSHNFFNPPTSVNDGGTVGVDGQYIQSKAFWANGGTITEGGFTSIVLDEWTQVIGLTISMGSGVNGFYQAGISFLETGYSPIPTPLPGETTRPVKPAKDEFYFLVDDSVVTPSVPEPATAALGTMVLSALALATRRRRV